MELKHSSLALIICSLFVSGAALANGSDTGHNNGNGHGGHGHGGHQSPGYDVDIDDSFNDKTFNYSDDDTLNYSDDDTYTKNYTKKTADFDWSNDQDWSMKVNTDIDMTIMTAKSKVMGKLEDVSVSYNSGSSGKSYGKRGRGGYGHNDSCCGGLTVKNTNSLDGFQNAAGITAVAQNVGGNALAQQSVSINSK